MKIRPAHVSNANQMSTLLNAIIAIGGTTAHETLYTGPKMASDYITAPETVSCTVAVLDGIVGFQTLAYPDPGAEMGERWAQIATFVADGMGGKGIGAQLFAMTCAAARTAGVKTIDATIRADNQSGLGYYEAIGFVDYDRIIDVPLKDGRLVDRIRKRFDL